MKTYQPLNATEISILDTAENGSPLRVYQTTNEQDLQVLQAVCTEIAPKDAALKKLISKMYDTVADPNKPGVGIAAPQIGVNRRVFLAQRLDKTDHPFEFFVNPEIVWKSDILRKGEEGCLSIAETYETVYRSYVIQLTYFDLEGTQFQEVIEGFTAVIMQHEMDHLNGILFTDRIEEQKNNLYLDASTKDELVYLTPKIEEEAL